MSLDLHSHLRPPLGPDERPSPLADPRAVVAAIDALQPGAIVASDADGTLWGCDIGDTLVALASSPPWRPWPAHRHDLAAYERTLRADYVAGCIASARLLADVDQRAARERLQAHLRDRLRPRRWLFCALHEASERGVRVVACSASARLIVQWGLELTAEVLQLPDIAGWDAVGLELAAPDAGDRADRGLALPMSVGHGKVAAMQDRYGRRPDLGLGDSDWDEPLLRSGARGFRLRSAIGSDDHLDTLALVRG